MAFTPPTNKADDGSRTNTPEAAGDDDEDMEAAALLLGATPRLRSPAVMLSSADAAAAIRPRLAADSRSSRTLVRLREATIKDGDGGAARRGVLTATDDTLAACAAALGVTATLAFGAVTGSWGGICSFGGEMRLPLDTGAGLADRLTLLEGVRLLGAGA